MTTKSLRLSLSVPKDLISGVDAIARKKKMSRSKLVSECLAEMLEKEKKELLAEGYKAMAKEHEGFAKLSVSAAREVQPPWK